MREKKACADAPCAKGAGAIMDGVRVCAVAEICEEKLGKRGSGEWVTGQGRCDGVGAAWGDGKWLLGLHASAASVQL